MERERYQLVVALGEGADGQRLREVLDRAAERAGKPVTVWARETLLTAAGDSTSSIDPIVEVRLLGTQVTTVNLRDIAAMQTGWSHQVRACLAGEWMELGTSDPEALFERWKRVCRVR
jgi:hypothetical protein